MFNTSKQYFINSLKNKVVIKLSTDSKTKFSFSENEVAAILKMKTGNKNSVVM